MRYLVIIGLVLRTVTQIVLFGIAGLSCAVGFGVTFPYAPHFPTSSIVPFAEFGSLKLYNIPAGVFIGLAFFAVALLLPRFWRIDYHRKGNGDEQVVFKRL